MTHHPDYPFSNRIPTDSTQAVRVWYRKLAGRYFRFALVTDIGGFGPVGQLTVCAKVRDNWTQIHRFSPAR